MDLRPHASRAYINLQIYKVFSVYGPVDTSKTKEPYLAAKPFKLCVA